MNGFEEVGFALRIATEQHVKARPEVGIEPPVVSKIPQSQMAQVHGRLWAEGGAGGNHRRAVKRAGGLCRRLA